MIQIQKSQFDMASVSENMQFKGCNIDKTDCFLNPIALRKAKIVYNFDLSECNSVRTVIFLHIHIVYSFGLSECNRVRTVIFLHIFAFEWILEIAHLIYAIV